MSTLRKWIDISRSGARGELVPEDIPAFALQKLQYRFYFWRNTEYSQRATWTDTIIQVIIISLLVFHYSLIGVVLATTTITIDNLVDFCNALSFLMGACTSLVLLRMFINWWNRGKMTVFFKCLNETVQKDTLQANLQLSLFCSYATMFAAFLPISTSIPTLFGGSGQTVHPDGLFR